MASLLSWSDLPQELLAMIKNRLESPSDICRFRSVCSTWRSSIPPLKMSLPFPHVFLNKYDGEYHHFSQISIYCIEPLIIETSSASPISWLIAVEFVRDKLYFVDPLTSLRKDPKNHPELPKELNPGDYQITELKKVYSTELLKFVGDETLTFPDMNINLIDETRKAVFISTAERYHEAMLAIITPLGNLVFYKLENNQWIVTKEIDNMKFTDIELYQGRIWGVTYDARTVEFTSSLDVIEIDPRLSYEDYIDTYFHFVESSGDLFVVEFNEPIEAGSPSTVYYGKDELVPVKIHKMIVDENRWIEVRDLEDRVFVVAREFPWAFSVPFRLSPCRRKNCIISSICRLDDDYDSDDVYDFGGFVDMIYSVWEIEKDEYDFRKLLWPLPYWLGPGKSM